jgi:hypothetical protein
MILLTCIRLAGSDDGARGLMIKIDDEHADALCNAVSTEPKSVF